MPYVPSEKTLNPKGIVKDEKAQDRVLIDEVVKKEAKALASAISTNREFVLKYLELFIQTGQDLITLEKINTINFVNNNIVSNLAKVIYKVAWEYHYQGAFLGELNYAITRLIQEVPKELVKQQKQKKELRYFIYAYTVEALVKTVYYFARLPDHYGLSGVFEDIKDEYKRRVNPSYEAHQIVKSGDCYNTPYHTKLIEVVDENGNHIGYQEIMIKHGDDNGLDVAGLIKIQYFKPELKNGDL